MNDAFSAAHRAHASTEGVARLLPSYAGKSMEAELDALDAALGNPRRPVLGIVGGSKVSSKIDLLKNLVTKLDKLAIGGGMANTFLHAQGWEVGASYCEKNLDATAQERSSAWPGKPNANSCCRSTTIVAEKLTTRARLLSFAASARSTTMNASSTPVLKRSPGSPARWTKSNTLIWNGPLGVFETPPFDHGTVAAARHASRLSAPRTASSSRSPAAATLWRALNHAGVANDLTFVSTAGGAFLEWMEGKVLPGVEALKV